MVGLLLHAFWPLLRPIRRQSCKMEEEVISHGSRVGFSGRLGMQLKALSATDGKLTRTGIFWSRTRISRLCYWISYLHGPAFPQLLCSMWTDSTRSLQRHCRNATKGRDGEVKVLRRNTYPVRLFDFLSNHGHVDFYGSDTRQTSPRCRYGWIDLRVSPERAPFRHQWCADD